jgi:hypothetical protein
MIGVWFGTEVRTFCRQTLNLFSYHRSKANWLAQYQNLQFLYQLFKLGFSTKRENHLLRLI